MYPYMAQEAFAYFYASFLRQNVLQPSTAGVNDSVLSNPYHSSFYDHPHSSFYDLPPA